MSRAAHVVGAGLSGLATAWHLADRGFAVTVFDRASSPGGLIGTRSTPLGLVETAANAFVWNDTVAGWFERLKIEPAFAKQESRRRYIFRDGRPRRWPLGPGESAAMAARLGVTALRRGFGARPRETVADWGHRVVGRAATKWLLEPAMQGVYAAPGRALSAEAVFGGRKRGPRVLAAPANGMGAFASELAALLADRGVQFRFDSPMDRVMPDVPTAVCSGAADAARLVADVAPDLAARLACIRVAPLTTVTAFFDPHPTDVRGFGILFPPDTGIGALGVLFNADIFPQRSAVRSETWILGGSGPVHQIDDAALLASVAADRERLTRRSQAPLATMVTRWAAAVPVYDQALLEARAAVAAAAGGRLAFAGNYLGRIGVANLLDSAAAAAASLDRPAREPADRPRMTDRATATRSRVERRSGVIHRDPLDAVRDR
jgi:oxygen-dependent protoporphyrinogen oxidase